MQTLSPEEVQKKPTTKRKIVFNDVSGDLSHGEKLGRNPRVTDLLKYFLEVSDGDDLKSEVLSLFLQAESLQPYLTKLDMSVAQMQVSKCLMENVKNGLAYTKPSCKKRTLLETNHRNAIITAIFSTPQSKNQPDPNSTFLHYPWLSEFIEEISRKNFEPCKKLS